MSDLFAVDGFLRPAFLVVLPAAAIYVIVLGLLGWSRTRAWARGVLPILRLGLVAGLLYALAAPALREESRQPGRIEIAVDVSRSIGTEGRRWAAERGTALLSELAERRPDLDVEAQVFAGGNRRAVSGRAADLKAAELRQAILEPLADESGEEPGLDLMRSDLAPALASLAAGGRSGVERRRLIITDGALEDPPLLLDRPRAGETGVDILPVPPAADRNLRLLAIDAPDRVVEGAGLPFVLSYRAAVAEERRLVISVDGVEVRRIDVALEAGEGKLSFEGRDLLAEIGRHRLELRCEGDDGEILDDWLATGFEVLAPRRPLYLRGREHAGPRDPAPLRALRAQGIRSRVLDASDALPGAVDWSGVSAVIIDRVSPAELNQKFADEIAVHVDGGGGLVLLPDSRERALLDWNEHRLGPWLPLRGLPAPPEPPKPEEEKPKPPPKPEDPKKLEDPDPDKAKFEEVDAPTLALVLVIDKSPSMKRGNRLTFAKRGAIATARELHPEDAIGVVTFHEVGIEAVPIQAAKNLDAIESEIMRIRPGGRGTDIERALEKSREMLSYEEAAVKLVILLSDGGSASFNVKKAMERMVADGITVATVGVGSTFDTELLTLIGLYGGGGAPIPARSSEEIPAVLVDLTSGMIAKKKARTRKDFDREEEKRKDEKRREEARRRGPERRVDEGQAEKEPSAAPPPETPEEKERILYEVERGVTYTDGLPWGIAPPLAGLHRAKEKAGAWVALRAEDGRPLLAHWRVGDGLAAMLAVPPEGALVGDLPLWEGYGPWCAQLLRFVERDPNLRRFSLSGEGQARVVDVRAVDAWARDRESPWTWTLRDGEGEVAVESTEVLGEGRFRLHLARELRGRALDLAALPPGEETPLLATLAVGLPAEVDQRGLDLEGLEAWREALGGRLVADIDAFLDDLPEDRVERELVANPGLLPVLLLLLFALDLLCKRLGRREEAGA
jgi:von Willebrand factor type A domain